MNQTSEWRLANSSEELDCLHSLQAANNSREHAQDTGFRSCRHGTFRRKLGEQAAVAGATEVWGENRDLAFELGDGPVDERFFLEKSGVVGAKAGGEIIGAVQDQIIAGEQIETVSDVEASRMFDDVDMRVDLGEAIAGAGEFWGVGSISVVKNLAVEIGEIDLIGVDEANRADSGRREVEDRRGAQSARADAKN